MDLCGFAQIGTGFTSIDSFGILTVWLVNGNYIGFEVHTLFFWKVVVITSNCCQIVCGGKFSLLDDIFLRRFHCQYNHEVILTTSKSPADIWEDSTVAVPQDVSLL